VKKSEGEGSDSGLLKHYKGLASVSGYVWRNIHGKQSYKAVYLSPLNRLASWISFGWIVTRLAWMAAKLVSSKRETK